MASDASQVAGWMVEQLSREGVLFYDRVVVAIGERFGDRYLGANDEALTISHRVLKEFGRLTVGTIAWEQHERCWRRRLQ